MDRRGLLALTVATLGAAATLTVGSRSNAQQADADGVRSTIDRFHAALGTLDVRNVDEFWVHDGEVVTINPRDKTFAVGWDAVRQSYQATFGFWSELAVAQKDAAHIRVNGAVAWVDGVTVASGKLKSGQAITGVLNFETCVLEKRDGRWLLVSRSVWRVPQ